MARKGRTKRLWGRGLGAFGALRNGLSKVRKRMKDNQIDLMKGIGNQEFKQMHDTYARTNWRQIVLLLLDNEDAKK